MPLDVMHCSRARDGGLGERQSRGRADVFFWYGLLPYGPMPSVEEPKPGLLILGISQNMAREGSRQYCGPTYRRLQRALQVGSNQP